MPSPRHRSSYKPPLKTRDYRIDLPGCYWLRDVRLLHAPDGSYRVKIDGTVYGPSDWVRAPLSGPELEQVAAAIQRAVRRLLGRAEPEDEATPARRSAAETDAEPAYRGWTP